MHSHISWHLALWKLGVGDIETVWNLIDRYVAPGVSQAFPLIVMTDYTAMLYRAERWQTIADYAHRFFPNPGVAFADAHAAMAYAMTGRTEALEAIIANPVGPAGDLVKELATAYQAIAQQDWNAAADLALGIADHARIGGSRAQRDLIEHTMTSVMLKLGRAADARRLLAMHIGRRLRRRLLSNDWRPRPQGQGASMGR